MSKAVNSKWKKTFPDTIGNQNRPATGVDDTQPFETGAFPQYMANDPVRYDLQNAAMSQLMSNDARLKEMVDARGKELDDHKVDPGAHKTGIAGNAATATKVVTTAATGASANIAEASMGGSDSARIRVSGAENAGELALETANDGDEAIVARQYTGVYTNAVRTAKILDESGNTSFPGTVVAPKFTGTLNGNAATASKLATPRTLSLTGKAAGSTTFDGSANVTINVTNVNADTATKLSTARKINITGNATGASTFDGTGDISINTTVNESKHAVNADTAAHANDVTDAVIKYDVSRTDEKFTAAASGVIGHLKNLTGSTDLTSMNKLRSYIGSVFNETNWFDVLSIRHRNGAADGQNFGLLMYSNLTNTDSIKYKKQPNGNGWTEERTLLDSSNYNNYAPTKTGSGASGTWPISVSGNAASATNANTAAACSGNSATATKLATPRTISLTGNASGSANFDGSGNVSIDITVSQAKNAAAADMATNDGNGANIANTYLKKATVIDVIYPVGSIYMSMSATNPHDLFGVGTWERISQGRMLLGADDSTYKAGATGGEATHTLTAEEMPTHNHYSTTSWSGEHTHRVTRRIDISNEEPGTLGIDTLGPYDEGYPTFDTSRSGGHNHTIQNDGGSQPHNNMSPYLVCYIWQRTA